ncbi:MAG: protein-methionine-sulfoxide reductase catalytic subunit MsrP [Alphaproteobacteria bacterium CG_4_10_14_0_2_um_filter_63_37]|nr:MAG: mononuclear molybdenum enzyme YedY [Proteobacteria bacterium CG1_02_64_396]PJA24143.1 MAG: protein-methionine-sulfoxide reductase catalytic subunit MsrP [Alphaproteobacteria bacterium CG_4_10_14_0_2_um_filter_63_37]
MTKIPHIPASEITDRELYLRRRDFIKLGAAATVGALSLAGLPLTAWGARKLHGKPSRFSTDETPAPKNEITQYNNFYEFTTDKQEVAEAARNFKTDSWSVQVEGEVENPRTFTMEELLTRFPLEERIYRLRCVEGWSMVVPWIGFELSHLLKEVRPTSKGKFVAFESVLDPKQMPNQNRALLRWPYTEGLRIDEAMHPLTLMVVGLYGEILPNQNGAPIRLAVPWKYGFKSAKSIVRIRLTETQPPCTWNISNPREYGFYSNVNPEVDHPRWSQARERRLGEWTRRPTLMFNGYGDEVAHLYTGMDLRKNF